MKTYKTAQAAWKAARAENPDADHAILRIITDNDQQLWIVLPHGHTEIELHDARIAGAQGKITVNELQGRISLW